MLSRSYALLLLIILATPLFAYGEQPSSSRIYVRTEVHRGSVLLRWVASDAQSWQLLNQYGVKLERLTVARAGVALPQPEVRLLAERLRPQETDQLKTLVGQYPLGAVIAQAVFGESFEVSLGESPLAKAIALDEALQQRYLFALYAADLCYPVAKEVGWGWEDQTPQPGERYLYRVSSLVPKEKLAIREGASFVVVGDTVRLPAPLELTAQFTPAGAYLRWDYERLATLYSAYWLERSDDGKTFQRISDLPLTRMSDAEKNPHAPITHLDSIPYRKTFYYRVAGVTPFGTQGAYSPVVSGMAYPPLTASPQLATYHFDQQGGASLSWLFPAEEEDLIEGFRILRSQDDKAYTPLDSVPTKERSYHLRSLAHFPYYRVEAKAKQGASTNSYPLLIQAVDSIPPAIPSGLKAEIDSLGVVRLAWQAGKDEDLLGYRLYRAETMGGEFIPLQPDVITGTSYVDSVRLDNLNTEIYYALTALDERYNQSEQSPAIALQKPSRIPPAMPLIIEANAADEGNLIRWEAGEDSSLAGFRLTRTTQDSTKQQRSWDITGASQRSFLDRETVSGKVYTYQLTAYSTGKMASPPSPAMRVATARKATSQDVSFSLELLPQGIALRWHASKSGLRSIQLYKSDQQGTLGLYRENLPAQGELIDTEIEQGARHAYLLLVKSRDARSVSIKREIQL